MQLCPFERMYELLDAHVPQEADRIPFYVNPALPARFRELLIDAEQEIRDMRFSVADDPEGDPGTIETQDTALKAAHTIPSTGRKSRQAFAEYHQATHAAKRKLGRDLTECGAHPCQHSSAEYAHVLSTHLALLGEGRSSSVSATLNAAFPGNPAKAKSIGNSMRLSRWKHAYKTDAVRNHPLEKAMISLHGKADMNRRCTARTFGQSLSIWSAMFASCDKIRMLEARVQELERQMAATKQREALADSGATNTKEMVLSLHRGGAGPTLIARQLGMGLERVRSIIFRAKKP